MSRWSKRRQFEYLGAAIAVLLAGVFLFLRSLQAPVSCFDGLKNQDELGVDCGGSCSAVCQSEVSDLEVLWSQVFRVSGGVYDAAALVENPNPAIGAERLSYRFRVFDEKNVLITERIGVAYVNPSERVLIFEPRLDTGERIPRRAFIDFEEVPVWKRVPTAARTRLVIEDKRFESVPRPRVTATVVNQSVAGVPDAEAMVVLSNAEGNAFAVSRTKVGRIAGDGKKSVAFTWPEPFAESPTFIEILVRTNLTD